MASFNSKIAFAILVVLSCSQCAQVRSKKKPEDLPASQTQKTGTTLQPGQTATAVEISTHAPLALDLGPVKTSINPKNGGGLFSIRLHCESAITGEGKQVSCHNQPLLMLKASLVRKTWKNQTLSFDQCRALAAPGKTGAVFREQKGGIEFSKMEGPAKLYDPKNNHLILAVSDGQRGCKYFSIFVRKD